jgi:molybdopterin converting factor small subunit
MSHFSLIRIKIKNPSTQLLKKTVEVIAKEVNGEVINSVRDYYGNVRADFIIGVKNNTFHRGVGVKINERGEVELIGDFWGIPNSEVERFKQLLVQNYTTLAIQESLIQLGYNVQTQKVQDKIYVRGVAL